MIPAFESETTVAISPEYHRWLIDRSDRLAEAEALFRRIGLGEIGYPMTVREANRFLERAAD